MIVILIQLKSLESRLTTKNPNASPVPSTTKWGYVAMRLIGDKYSLQKKRIHIIFNDEWESKIMWSFQKRRKEEFTISKLLQVGQQRDTAENKI